VHPFLGERVGGEKEKDFSILTWKWKISNVVRSAIETRKDRFDAAARVIVVFGKEKGTLEGTLPRGLKIQYIWASHLPKGHVFEHPGENPARSLCWSQGTKRGTMGQ
jgi:hypothetical protein